MLCKLTAKNQPIKSLFTNISLAVILNLVIKSAWILVNNMVQDEIGHDDFGLYAGLYALGFLFIAFSDLGLNQYATKTIAGNQSLLKSLFPSLFTVKIVLAVLYPLFMLGVGWILGYSSQELIYLVILCLAQALVQIIFFFRATFQAFQHFRIDAVASIFDRLILLLIVIFLLWQKEISLNSYVIAGLISVAVSMILLYFFILKMFGWIKPGFKVAEISQLLKDSLPFAVVTIMYSVMDKVDQVMLKSMAGDHENGLYAGAYRWVDAVMMYLWTILPIFFAKFSFHIKDFPGQKRLLDFGQGLAAIPMIFSGVFVWFYAEKLLFLFTNSTTLELEIMAQCLRILFLSVIVNGIFAIFSTLLTSTNHEKFVSWMIFIGIFINIAFNYIFIPAYGAVASAWTTLGSYIFLSITYVVYIQVKLPYNVSFGNLGKIFLISALFFGLFYGLTLTALPWWAVSGIAGIALAGMSLGAGLLKFGQELK